MNKRLLLPLLIIVALVAGIGWADFTTWSEIAELQRQLRSPALARVLAHSEQWPAEE